MARVTVEDCIMEVPNRFELVLLASQRAKQLSVGNPLTVERDNDKDSVVSLREIADKTISLPQLEETLIQSFFKRQVSDIADQKLLTSGEEIAADVEEAFKEAAQSISDSRNTGAAADDDADSDADMAFGGDDVQAED
ncbi:MAG: DNA-directed RNA polymerase subunit omega [Alphaproteobacteria bacterium]|nr:DNA-directed RNA polymerase subunit omega [Alphaproteobacteria bacterium]